VTISHGHSTPEMAAKFARDVSAMRLVLTHFSPRYKWDPTDTESVEVMERIVRLAKSQGIENVTAAHDLMMLVVPKPT
jgi:ribonuclease Z